MRSRAVKSKSLVGIDLGTSYSSLSCLDAKFEARPIPNQEGEFKTPSAVYFAEEGGGLVVGAHALRPGFAHPERFVTHAKRYLGESDVCWEIDGVFYKPVDIASLILRKLLQDAQTELGPIAEAVITVPAHFNDLQRKLTIEAGRHAGLETVHLLNEPVAAALCFALGTGGKEMLYLHDDCTVLIYDLGGGTFDLSLVRFDQTQLRVLATSGELRLGGLDWDQRLVDWFTRTFKVLHGVDLTKPKHHLALRRLGQEIENSKRRLSDRAIPRTELFFQHNGKDAEFEVERAAFENDTKDLVERTRVLTEDLLKMAGLNWDQIDNIIPVGGSTRMPMIGRLIETFANRGPILYPLSPDLTVSMGAALYAGILQGDDTKHFLLDHPQARSLADYSATVVSAKGLGILVADRADRMVSRVLIPRNTTLPATANLPVQTIWENQSTVSLKIVECDGEAGTVPPIVCKCTLHDLPPRLPIGSIFDVELSYDSQGLIQVIARHRDSGRLASLSTRHQPASAATEPARATTRSG